MQKLITASEICRRKFVALIFDKIAFLAGSSGLRGVSSSCTLVKFPFRAQNNISLWTNSCQLVRVNISMYFYIFIFTTLNKICNHKFLDSSKMYKVAPYYDSNYEITPRNFMYHMPNLSKIGNSTCAKLSGKQAAVKNLENHSQTEYQISDNSEKDEQQDLRLSAINEKIRFVRDMVDKMIKLYGLDISASEKRLFISSAEVKNSEITIERKKDTSLLFLSHDNSKFTDLFKKNCLLGEIIIHIPVFVDPAVICALYLTLACHPAVTLTQCIHSSAISTSIPFYDLFSSLPKHAEGDVQIKVRMMWINKLENFPVVQIDLKKHVICGAVAVLKVLAALAGFHKIYHNPEDAERKMDYWCWAALRYKKDTTNILKMLNTSLTDKCIVGNRLSLADIFMWSQLFMDNSKSKTLHLANIQRWFNNCTRCVPFNDVVAFFKM
ncbi:Aminoacyl tRNA synthase complex-interacting multifunctional protein 2 [Trichinella pseudospiralis]|uniref:Aminoacyl tRNA synthase complex-interacting multifunctional protein 2 n=1 Tax=Trichinella pseudospiralis TaxID=6337 RepID=A0A0V1EG10_TRIPS|nr:Aminoacyl tRNA synthase complex-interacting multifunctional protein 2 [Trichinella pseudospiralis]